MTDAAAELRYADAAAADSVDSLVVAWQHPETRAISPVGLLERTDDGFAFSYLRSAAELEDFRPFLGFPEIGVRYTSRRLFPLFRQRLMEPGRPDFGRYLDTLGLDAHATALAILARSGGRRAGDTLFLVQKPSIGPDGSTCATFFVHGVRYQPGAAELLSALEPHEGLQLVPEPENPKNPRAILVTTARGDRLGWVPDLLVDYVQAVLSSAPPVVRVVQVNGADAPPNLRLLVELRGRVPAGHAPFGDRTCS